MQADVEQYKEIAKRVLPLVGDTVELINDAWDEGKRILIEGANATMLDLDFGTYPFVTSSNPSIGGVATGLGLPPTKFEAIIGVVCVTFLSKIKAEHKTLRSSFSFVPPVLYRLYRICRCCRSCT
jgi:adenylosuccinate synthase